MYFFCCISQRNVALSLVWRHCTIALKKLVAVENTFLLWFQWKKWFLFIHYVFQKTKTKQETKNKQKIISSRTWFSKRLLSFVLNEKYLCLHIMFPEMKQTVSFIITTMIRLILFMNFQYSINYMTIINYQKITGRNWLLVFT